jgi:hypothetical protein
MIDRVAPQRRTIGTLRRLEIPNLPRELPSIEVGRNGLFRSGPVGFAILVFVSLSMHCFDVAGDETLAQRQIRSIEETFGVDVFVADRPLNTTSARGTLTGNIVPPEEASRYLRVLSREIFLYPVDAVKRSRLRRIVICSDLALRAQEIGGMADCAGHTLFLNATVKKGYARYCAAVIHHELFHLIDYSDGAIEVDKQWASANPAGFAYENQRGASNDPWGAEFTQNCTGFLTRYCLQAIEEDKAEIFSHLIVNGAYVEERAKRDPLLRAKVNMLKSAISRFSAEIDEMFWATTSRLRRPTSASDGSAVLDHEVFLEALEGQRLYDVAIDYLMLRRTTSSLPEAQILAILADEGRLVGSATRQCSAQTVNRRILVRGCDRFAALANSAPSCAIAAGAETQLGNLLLERASCLMSSIDAPEERSNAIEATREARELLNLAKAAFDRSAVLYNQRLRELKAGVDGGRESDAARSELRNSVRGGVLSARISSALALQRLAETYERGTLQKADLLKRAAENYRRVYEQHRRLLAGLTALLNEAQCRHELNHDDGAISSLENILSYPNEPALRQLRACALHLLLRLLSDSKSVEQNMIAARGEEWLEAAASTDLASADGIGIAYFTALAAISVIERTHDLETDARVRCIATAEKWAAFVAQAPARENPYAAPAILLQERLVKARAATRKGATKGQLKLPCGN